MDKSFEDAFGKMSLADQLKLTKQLNSVYRAAVRDGREGLNPKVLREVAVAISEAEAVLKG